MNKKSIAALLLFSATVLGACASDGMLGFNSDAPTATAAIPERPKTDPACAALASRIGELRREGAVERVSKASQGKGDTVSVKRVSLAKVSELDKVNTEFQAKCSSYPVPVTAASNPTAAPATPAAAPKAPVAKKAAASEAPRVAASN
jgi:hypothetical protein